jgi:4'-phosphopantetheinyl transferase
MPRKGCVTVWRIDLAAPPARLARCEATLDADERARAERFRFPEHRRRFIGRRGALREICAAHLDVPAQDVRFSTGAWGKPALAGDSPPLHFNLSHSHDLALVAVAPDREVGIDIECATAAVRWDDIARSCCAPSEYGTATGSAAATLAYWTCKEAFLKAIGRGLSLSPRQVELSPSPIEGTQVGVTGYPEWSLRAFAPDDAYRAAVAAPGRDWSVDLRDWTAPA